MRIFILIAVLFSVPQVFALSKTETPQEYFSRFKDETGIKSGDVFVCVDNINDTIMMGGLFEMSGSEGKIRIYTLDKGELRRVTQYAEQKNTVDKDYSKGDSQESMSQFNYEYAGAKYSFVREAGIKETVEGVHHFFYPATLYINGLALRAYLMCYQQDEVNYPTSNRPSSSDYIFWK